MNADDYLKRAHMIILEAKMSCQAPHRKKIDLSKDKQFRYNANIENIKCSETYNLTKPQLSDFADCNSVRWIERTSRATFSEAKKPTVAERNVACATGWNVPRTTKYNIQTLPTIP